jgi:amidohydrolase
MSSRNPTNADRTSSELKRDACAAIDALASTVIDVSHDIHAHPELNYEETHAHDLLTSALGSAFAGVTRSAYGVDTAFHAVREGSKGAARVGILLEYDALPEIGHACGHNVIAAAGLGAALALAPIATSLGVSLEVFGTPAEEGGGGKIAMARNGAFRNLDAAMMVHPGDVDLTAMRAIAIHECCAHFHGREAHAAAFPHKGLNALDGAVLAYNSIAALRQHIRPSERIHGVFTHGGDKANIVPKYASMNWYVRSDTLETLKPLKKRVEACFLGAAQASGCTVDIEWEDHSYADVRDSVAILSAYVENGRAIGREFTEPRPENMVVGSTDMGNVSYLAPSIHPVIKVAPSGVPIHTARFTEYAGGPEGDRAAIDGAKVLAMTAIDLWTNPDLLAAARDEFASIGPVPEGAL